MRFQILGTFGIALIGIHVIFSAVIFSAPFISSLVVGAVTRGGSAHVESMALLLIPDFIIPLVFGMVLILKAANVSRCGYSKTQDNSHQARAGTGVESASYLLFSLLGLFMVSNALPGALKLVAKWLMLMPKGVAFSLGISRNQIWSGHLVREIVIDHVFPIGFGCFVFFGGRRISRFVLSLGKNGAGDPGGVT